MYATTGSSNFCADSNVNTWPQPEFLATTLVVQMEQSARSVCVCVRTISLELNDLWPRHLSSWCILILSQIRMSRSSRSWNKKMFLLCATVVGETWSEGFLVTKSLTFCKANYIAVFIISKLAVNIRLFTRNNLSWQAFETWHQK